MRGVFGIGLAVVLALALLAGVSQAQQGSSSRRSTTIERTSTIPPGGTGAQYQADPPSRDASGTHGYSGNEQYRRASSEPPPRRAEPTRTPPASHNYFPGMRPSQAPNANYIPPHHLCAPGRRPFMYR